MKKLLLLFALLGVTATYNAQIIFTDGFESGTPFLDGWSVLDLNADGDQWQIFDVTGFGPPTDGQGFMALSSSATPPLPAGVQPDNVLLTPSIDLTAATGTIQLSFKAGSDATTASGKYEDFISVYVLTSFTPADIAAATPVYAGALTAGAILLNLGANISASAGSIVKIAFRHHNCLAESSIFIDDILVEKLVATTLTLTCGADQNLLSSTSPMTMPNVTTTATAATDCAGNVVTLTQSPAAGSALTVGANSVTVTATDNCGNTQTCTMVVNFTNDAAITLTCGADQTIGYIANGNSANLPDVTTTATASSTCSGAVVTKTQSPAAGTAMTEGVNTVTVTATDNCGNTQTCTMVVNYHYDLGIDDNELAISKLIYPNPSTDLFHIDMANVSQVQIFAMNGDKVLTINGQSIKEMNVSSLNKGMYIVELTTVDQLAYKLKFEKN